MAGFLDGHTLGVRCWRCDRKSIHSIGWIKVHKAMPCGGCGATIRLDAPQLVGEIKRVEQLLSDFARGIGKH
jgi:hypothetical protein